jgi:hemerythrin-like domain-containing protein
MSDAFPLRRITGRPYLATAADGIEILASEHAALRAACADLEVIGAAARPEAEAARNVAARLRAVLPRHMAEEEAFLFPLLRERAEPEDEIDRILARLTLEHEEGGAVMRPVLDLLDRIGDGYASSPEERVAIGAFAAAKLRHISIETAIVLPIARMRLSAADRAAIGAAMEDRGAFATVAP